MYTWLVIFRKFRLAISPTLLLVATLAVFLSNVGWGVAPYIFLTENQRAQASPAPPLGNFIPPAVAKYLPAEQSAARAGYLTLADPLFSFFRRELTINHAAYYAFMSLWTRAIWALAGGIITRRAVLEFGAEETPGFVETVKF